MMYTESTVILQYLHSEYYLYRRSAFLEFTLISYSMIELQYSIVLSAIGYTIYVDCDNNQINNYNSPVGFNIIECLLNCGHVEIVKVLLTGC